MLSAIIKREVLEYLKSAKFLIGFGISALLITISTIINIQDYQQRQQDYVAAKEEFQDRFYIDVFRPPQVLSTLVQGKDRKLGNRLTMTYLNIPSRPSGYMGEYTSKHYRYMAGFSSVDFAFVVRVVLSLMVIFLAYNAISEEKFKGTLKQVLANRLPRDQLLLGKFLGGLVVVIGSLFISVILAWLILLFHPAISLVNSDWIFILGLLGVSALYLTCFYTLSLFISVIVSRPSMALTILLQLWIFLIIIYPNLGVVIADTLFSLPSEQEIAQRKAAAFQPYEEEFERVRKAFSEAVRSAQGVPKELSVRNFELWTQKTMLNHQVDSEFNNRLTQQMKLAQSLSILSPATVFDQVANRYARTGMVEYEKYMNGVFRYWQEFIEHYKLRYEDREAYRNSKLPDFSYSSEDVGRSFVAILPQWLLLFLFSLIFFVLAYIGFLRKDVR